MSENMSKRMCCSSVDNNMSSPVPANPTPVRIIQFPDLVLLCTFSHVPYLDMLLNIPLTCRRWHRLAGEQLASRRHLNMLIRGTANNNNNNNVSAPPPYFDPEDLQRWQTNSADRLLLDLQTRVRNPKLFITLVRRLPSIQYLRLRVEQPNGCEPVKTLVYLVDLMLVMWSHGGGGGVVGQSAGLVAVDLTSDPIESMTIAGVITDRCMIPLFLTCIHQLAPLGDLCRLRVAMPRVKLFGPSSPAVAKALRSRLHRLRLFHMNSADVVTRSIVRSLASYTTSPATDHRDHERLTCLVELRNPIRDPLVLAEMAPSLRAKLSLLELDSTGISVDGLTEALTPSLENPGTFSQLSHLIYRPSGQAAVQQLYSLRRLSTALQHLPRLEWLETSINLTEYMSQFRSSIELDGCLPLGSVRRLSLTLLTKADLTTTIDTVDGCSGEFNSDVNLCFRAPLGAIFPGLRWLELTSLWYSTNAGVGSANDSTEAAATVSATLKQNLQLRLVDQLREVMPPDCFVSLYVRYV